MGLAGTNTFTDRGLALRRLVKQRLARLQLDFEGAASNRLDRHTRLGRSRCQHPSGTSHTK